MNSIPPGDASPMVKLGYQLKHAERATLRYLNPEPVNTAEARSSGLRMRYRFYRRFHGRAASALLSVENDVIAVVVLLGVAFILGVSV